MTRISKLKSILAIAFDKNLYGRSFATRSLPYLGFGLFIQSSIYLILAPHLLPVYLTVILGLVVFSGLAAKNSWGRRQYHPMEWWLALLMLFSSAFSLYFPFFFPFEGTLVGILGFIVVVVISEVAYVISLTMIVINGQRISLREKIGLGDDFFKKHKHIWKDKLTKFPNFDTISESLDEGSFVIKLFDSGYFNLAVLFSCNIMEKAVTSISNDIISANPGKEALFRKEDGKNLRYPTLLRNLGFKSLLTESNRKFHAETLWHKVRNDIAHRNYIPTFYETSETLKILISFVKETPSILRNWKT